MRRLNFSTIGTKYNLISTRKFSKLFKICINFKQRAGDLCDYFAAKLKHRNKLIKMIDRSVAGYDIVGEYKTESIAGKSEDRKKIGIKPTQRQNFSQSYELERSNN